jgi:hydrogenase maturation protease
MNGMIESSRSGPFAALRRFARAPVAEERCELCGAALPPVHRHLLEMASHKVTCACDPCALRFQNVTEGRFKLIPRDTRTLVDFQLTDAMWENLALPINLAFFFYSSQQEKIIALYPIRSYDLAYAIMDGYDATILIDTVQRGGTPGMLYLIELDPDAVERLEGESVNAHGMSPVIVLQMVKSLGGTPGRLFLVGCEAGVLEPEDGAPGLSVRVEAAVPQAIEMVLTLVKELPHETQCLQTNLIQQ